MKSPTVRVMAAADEDLAVQIAVLAFAADPMARWTWPHAHQYLAAMPRMVRAFGAGHSPTEAPFAPTTTPGRPREWLTILQTSKRQESWWTV